LALLVGRNLKESTHNISVGNLQLSVRKLQLPAPPHFLTHDAAACHTNQTYVVTNLANSYTMKLCLIIHVQFVYQMQRMSQISYYGNIMRKCTTIYTIFSTLKVIFNVMRYINFGYVLLTYFLLTISCYASTTTAGSCYCGCS